jgi:hypothetical protein
MAEVKPAEAQREETATMSTVMDEKSPAPAAAVEDDAAPAAAPPTGRLRWWLVAVVVAVAAVAVVVIVVGGGEGGTPAASETMNYSEAVRTDLVETESYDATLGTVEGDPIASQVAGTVTAAAAEGATVSQGEALFSVDGDPVVLLYGESPAYRDLGPTDDTVDVLARRNGTVTAVVADGAVLEQGDVAYWVDGEPVVVLYGDVPAYRAMQDLGEDVEGADVLQLETALAALGYMGFTVDEVYTGATESAVEDWQEDLGAAEDGVVDLGDVVFVPGPVTVLDVTVSVGDAIGDGAAVLTVSGATPTAGDDVAQLEQALVALGFDAGGTLGVDGVWDSATTAAVRSWQEEAGMAVDGVVDVGEMVFRPGAVRVSDQQAPPGSALAAGSPVLGITSADKVVTLELPAADQDVIVEGSTVVVQLPDGTDVAATVEAISAVATVSASGNPVFEVTITLDDPSVAGGLDEAPVDVEVVADSAEDVLAVPVTALLALAEGGYAVEVDAGGGTTRLVAVDPGFFAGGLVEVTSTELQEGDRVVVP